MTWWDRFKVYSLLKTTFVLFVVEWSLGMIWSLFGPTLCNYGWILFLLWINTLSPPILMFGPSYFDLSMLKGFNWWYKTLSYRKNSVNLCSVFKGFSIDNSFWLVWVWIWVCYKGLSFVAIDLFMSIDLFVSMGLLGLFLVVSDSLMPRCWLIDVFKALGIVIYVNFFYFESFFSERFL